MLFKTIHLLTYLLTYLPTYLPTYLLTQCIILFLSAGTTTPGMLLYMARASKLRAS